jgi:hypothetical protein
MDVGAGGATHEPTNKDVIRRRIATINTRLSHNVADFYDMLSKDISRERAENNNNKGVDVVAPREGLPWSAWWTAPWYGHGDDRAPVRHSFIVNNPTRARRAMVACRRLLFLVLLSLALAWLERSWWGCLGSDRHGEGLLRPDAHDVVVEGGASPIAERRHEMIPWQEALRGRHSQTVRVSEMTRYVVESVDGEVREEVRGEAEGGRPVSSAIDPRRTEAGAWRHAGSPPLERLHGLESAMRRLIETDGETPCTCAREWGYLLRVWAFRAPGSAANSAKEGRVGVSDERVLVGYNCAVLDPSDAEAAEEAVDGGWARRHAATPRSRVTLHNHAVYPDRLPAQHSMLNAVLLRCDSLSPMGAVTSALVTDHGVAWCLQACGRLDVGVPLFDRW